MSNDYRQMWQDLGLDLAAHDMLLNALGAGYTQVFLSQKNRPDAMGYFDFVMSEVHGLRIRELLDAKQEGRKVFGAFCVFVPEELVLAVDGILVGLCTGADFATDKAEELLPRNTCSLIKSAFGFKLGKVCPYMESSDMIIGENTCDGKKKAYESLKEIIPNLYVMDLPQMKTESGKALLKSEYLRFKEAVEDLTGIKISADRLKKGIRQVNEKRAALHRLSRLRAHNPAPISGLDALLINQVAFYDDPVRFTVSVHLVCDELEARIKQNTGVFPAKTPRVIISGCPMAVPNWKVPAIVESAGMVIVGEESCVGERGTRNLVDNNSDSLDTLMDNIVNRYFDINCAVFTPNPNRLSHVEEMVETYHADGVIHYGLQFCQPYLMEAIPLEKRLDKQGIPVLRIETDYSSEDAGQLKTRTEAFREQIGSAARSAV